MISSLRWPRAESIQTCQEMEFFIAFVALYDFPKKHFHGQRPSMISFHEQLKWPSFFFITLVTEHQCEFRLGKMYFIEWYSTIPFFSIVFFPFAFFLNSLRDYSIPHKKTWRPISIDFVNCRYSLFTFVLVLFFLWHFLLTWKKKQTKKMSTDVETEPSDSGYADSTRSGTGSGRSSTPEPIYYSALELADKKVKQQNAEVRPSAAIFLFFSIISLS